MVLKTEEIKATEVVTAENAAELEPGRQMNVPYLPESSRWLGDVLKTIRIPDVIDAEFLMNLGDKVYAAKLADREMERIQSPGSKRKLHEKLEPEDVEVILMSMFTFKAVQLSNRIEDVALYMYIDDESHSKYGTYVSDTITINYYIKKIAPSFTPNMMKNIHAGIMTHYADRIVKPTTDRYLFAVNNGVFNQKTRELMPFSSKYIFLTKIPVNYVENPVSPVYTAPDGYKWSVDPWLLDLMSDDPDCVELVWQVIADSLQPNYSRKKSIWFYSRQGNNGKGTVGQLIKNLVGEGNYSSLNVAAFGKPFASHELMGVAVNIADENKVGEYADAVDDYKASITGDNIRVEKKYGHAISFQFRGANIQMMNGLPKTKDKSESWYRRLVILPFLKSFTNNGERGYIKDDYIHQQDVLEYVLHKALNIEFDEYIIPAQSAKLLSEYKQENNTVLDFWLEIKDELAWDLVPYSFMHDAYKNWMKENNPSSTVMSRIMFKQNIITVIGDDDDWGITDGLVRPKDLMDADEPLITTFGLDVIQNGERSKWMNKNVAVSSGTNDEKRRDFKRAEKYDGIIRK